MKLSVDLDLCSTERTVGRIEFSLDPLHDAVLVEQVLAWRLPYYCTWLEVLHADGAAVLIVFVLRLAILELLELLEYESQKLLFVLFLYP